MLQMSKKINYDALLDLDLAAAQPAPLAIMDTPSVEVEEVEKVGPGSKRTFSWGAFVLVPRLNTILCYVLV